MKNNLSFLDWITLISFGIGLYALYIALENLDENREQEDELKKILHYFLFIVQQQPLTKEHCTIKCRFFL